MKHAILRALSLVPLLVGLLACPAWAQAPAWQTAMRLDNNHTPVDQIVVGPTGDVYLEGKLAGSATFGSTTLTLPYGFFGLYVAKWSATTHSFAWAVPVTSGLTDFTADKLTVLGNSVYVAGRMAQTLSFGNITVASGRGNGVYLAKLLDLGTTATWTWALSASTTGYPQVGGIAAVGSYVYVAGTFAGTLTAGSTVLTAVGGGNMFVLRSVDNGYNAAFSGAYQNLNGSRCEATALVSKGTDLFLAGTFADTLTLGPNTLSAAYSTGGESLFVAKLLTTGAVGTFEWAQQGVGGFIETPLLTSTEAGVYVAGTVTFTSKLGTSSVAPGQFIAKVLDAGSTGSFGWAVSFSAQGALGQYEPHHSALALAAQASTVYVACAANYASFGATTMQAVGSDDIVLASFADAGATAHLNWVQQAGGPSFDYPTSVAVGRAGQVYVSGYTMPPASFSNIVLPASNYGGFLASLTDISLLATRPAALTGLGLYPNPAHGMATVRVPAGAGPAILTLLDALGRVVRSTSAPAGADYPFALTGIAPGLYTLRVQAGEALATQKLVVE